MTSDLRKLNATLTHGWVRFSEVLQNRIGNETTAESRGQRSLSAVYLVPAHQTAAARCPHRILQWALCMAAHLLWTKLLYSRWANKNLHIYTHKCILLCKGMFKFWALLVPDINPGSVRWQQWSWWWAPGESESVPRCLWTISLPPVFLTTWKDLFLYGINTTHCRAKCYTKIAFPLLHNFKKNS